MNISSDPKRVLIYGDSYTFGKIPGGNRFTNNIRFTGILQERLGEKYEIIEEGLRGRLLNGENAFFPYRNGFEQFGPILGSHLPVDLIVIFLGTNDTNSGANRLPEEIVKSFDAYLDRIHWWCEHLDFPQPKILLIGPPNIVEKESYKIFNDIFKDSGEKIKKLLKLIEEYSNKNNLSYFDSSKIISTSTIDGIHLDENANRILGETLAAEITEII